MGARVEGIGSNVLTVHGAAELHGCTHRIGPDHIEVASFIGLAAVTGGDIVIEDAAVEHLRAIRLAFARLGVEIEMRRRALFGCRPTRRCEIVDDIHDQIPKIEDGPWPMFPADLTSIALAVATQATRHGADLREDVREPAVLHRQAGLDGRAGSSSAIPTGRSITGPRKLYGYRMESPDIRAGMALLIASLCAEGKSRIGNIGQIDRGYERIDERLRALGARIERIET